MLRIFQSVDDDEVQASRWRVPFMPKCLHGTLCRGLRQARLPPTGQLPSPAPFTDRMQSMHHPLQQQHHHKAALSGKPPVLRHDLPVRIKAGPHRAQVAARATEEGPSKGPQEFGLVVGPAKPKTPYGEMLQYYLKMQPELFRSAVEDQLRRLKEEREAKEASMEASDSDAATDQDQAQLTLFKRMEEVRASEVRATLEDLMYVSILEKFVVLGVDMLPRMDGYVDAAPVNLKALTESMHSKEALELVREHLLQVMGPTASAQFSNAYLKMSKFQMAQVYAASIMFGYFLRRVDQRFQLDKAMGTLSVSREDAVARLEKLFATAEAEDIPVEERLDGEATTRSTSPLSSSASSSEKEEKGSSTADWLGGPTSSSLPTKKQKTALRRYVESFDQATMVETARIVSIEGAALVERQVQGVLGDIKKLTQQMQQAVGQDATSMQEVMERMAKAVETDSIETLTMTVGTQRRAVLEAVAFGTFLRDVETEVDTNYGLLTIRAPLMLKGGPSPFDDDDDE